MEKSSLDILNNWFVEQPAISTLVFAIIGGYAFKIFEYLRISLKVYSVKTLKSSARKNASMLIELYKEEYDVVHRMKNRDTSELYSLLENLYRNMVLIFIYILLFFGAKAFTNEVLYYSLLGSSTIPVIRIILNFTNHEKLFRYANNFESYSTKIQKKIARMEKFLSEQK
jgi:uncharacterized membrane protein (DUF106 family)